MKINREQILNILKRVEKRKKMEKYLPKEKVISIFQKSWNKVLKETD